MVQYKIVMVRHGESKFNKLNLFCGWFDAELSEQGLKEAESAAETLKKGGYKFDKAFTSVLKRANDTLGIILKGIDQSEIPVIKSWRLNERHYGALTGLNKQATAQKYGDEQVAIWRRSFDVPPPPMEPSHELYDAIVKDKIYSEEPKIDAFPMFESLKLTIERTLPFWDNVIVPEIKAGKQLIIAAHGNSLRGIVKHLDKMSDEQIMGLNLPTGIPFVYTLDENMNPVEGGSLQFLGEPDVVKKAMEAVANQGKSK